MKRDLEIVREILLECEAADERWFEIGVHEQDYDHEGNVEIWMRPSLSSRKVFHIELMEQANLIKRHTVDDMVELARDVFEVTWEGYEYLDAVRSDGVWEETKRVTKRAGGSLTYSLTKTLALSFLKKRIKELTGEDL